MNPVSGMGDLGTDIATWKQTRDNLEQKKTDAEQFKRIAKTTREHVDQLVEVDIHDLETSRKAVKTLDELKTILEMTQTKISELTRNKSKFGPFTDLNPVVDETLAKIDQVLLNLGRKQHELQEKEEDAKEAKGNSYLNKFKSFMGQKAAGASTAVSVQDVMRITPKAPNRPYKTFWTEFPGKGLETMQGIAIGTQSSANAFDSTLGVPHQFDRDVAGKTQHHLNGVLISRSSDLAQKTKEIYAAFCKAFGEDPAKQPEKAYLLATLLQQAAFIPHYHKATALLGTSVKEDPGTIFPPINFANHVYVQVDKDKVKISYKTAFQGRDPPNPVILLKREITFKRSDFEEHAHVIIAAHKDLERMEKQLADEHAKVQQSTAYKQKSGEDQVKADRKHKDDSDKILNPLREHIRNSLFLQMTVEDAYSSPIAAKALAVSFLPSF